MCHHRRHYCKRVNADDDRKKSKTNLNHIPILSVKVFAPCTIILRILGGETHLPSDTLTRQFRFQKVGWRVSLNFSDPFPFGCRYCVETGRSAKGVPTSTSSRVNRHTAP